MICVLLFGVKSYLTANRWNSETKIDQSEAIQPETVALKRIKAGKYNSWKQNQPNKLTSIEKRKWRKKFLIQVICR